MSKLEETTTREAFISLIADVYAELALIDDRAEALALADATLRFFLEADNIEFGDPAYDWTRSGAEAIAREDMSYWEN